MARKPTKQQAAVIHGIKEYDELKVEACAGSGKTSTLTMTAEGFVAPSLYFCFNRVTADEAKAKFPRHVDCVTTHGKAYSVFGAQLRDKLSRPKGKYVNVAGTGTEIGRFYGLKNLSLEDDMVQLSASFLGLLVKGTVARFEQSADKEVSEKHIPRAELAEKYLKAGIRNNSYVDSVILGAARKLWKDRSNVNSPVLATHDTYLKLWQLSEPILHGYEVLYVDEFQDTTPCVLDIVLRQRGHMKIVVVGDARQAIYGWRGAVNAMKMVPFKSLSLTKSFRYGQAVADIASTVLEGKLKIEGNEAIKSVAGLDKVDKAQPYTRLFRTNAALLVAAVEEIQAGTAVSIEIDVKDFVKLMESALALHGKDLKGVKHDKILPYQTWDELAQEAKHDPELGRVSKLIGEGNAEHYVEVLEQHVNSKEPHVTFTTAHKSKGREWSQVMIESDFKSCYNEGGWVGLTEEEQNLLYVAVTRAIDRLDYNQTVVEYLGKSMEEFQGYERDDSPFERMPALDFDGFKSHDYGMSLRGEQAQYAAMQQEAPHWA